MARPDLEGRAGTTAATREPMGADVLNPKPRAEAGADRDTELAIADIVTVTSDVRARVIGRGEGKKHTRKTAAREQRFSAIEIGHVALQVSLELVWALHFSFCVTYPTNPCRKLAKEKKCPPHRLLLCPTHLLLRHLGARGVAFWFPNEVAKHRVMWSLAKMYPVAVADTVARVSLVLLVASFAGRLCAKFRLPRISGYLLTGAVLGPRALMILTEQHTTRLGVTDSLCLAVIGVAAGAELKVQDLSRQPRPTLVMTLCITVFSFVFVFLAFLVVGPRVAFLEDLNTIHVITIASLLGTLAVARSPASAIAVLKEMDGKGPFCQHVMAVTVVKDALVVVLFALNVEAVGFLDLDFTGGGSGQLVTSGSSQSQLTTLNTQLLATIATPVVSVAFAFVFGAVFGAALSVVVRPKFLLFSENIAGNAKRLTRSLVVASLASAAFTVSDSFHVEPLLLCVVAGAACANGVTGDTKETERDTLHAVVGTLMPAVNLLFFTVIGATIRFDKVLKDVNLLLAALVVFAARLFGLFHATSFAKDVLLARSSVNTPSFFKDSKTTDVLYLSMITQAGVAMGLVKSCERRFPGWGGEFASLAAATIVLNLVTGPICFRHAIVAAGESGVVVGSGKKHVVPDAVSGDNTPDEQELIGSEV